MKLVAVRQELKTMTEHWRKEWREAVVKWSEMITVADYSDYSNNEIVKLPTDYGANYHLLPLWEYQGDERNLDDAVNYYSVHANKYLFVIPLNLMVVVYRHLVLAFGGKFLHTSGNRLHFNHHTHYLWTGPTNSTIESSYKRHREVIHLAAPNIFAPLNGSIGSVASTVSTASIVSVDKFDGWEMVIVMGFLADDKLKSSYYIKGLLVKLQNHQMDRMVEYYFNARCGRDDELMKTAKTFLSQLVFNVSGVIVMDDNFVMHTLSGKDEVFDIESAVKIKGLSKIVGNLTTEDVSFIVTLLLDGERDKTEMQEKIKKIELTSSTISVDTLDKVSFPGPDDHFTSFDFPYLRGVLAESILSRKLRGHTLSIEAIREVAVGSFAAVAPSALVEIAAEYLPVNLLSS